MTRSSANYRYSRGERVFERAADFPRSSNASRAVKTAAKGDARGEDATAGEARGGEGGRDGGGGGGRDRRRRWRLPEIPRDVCVCPWKSAKEVSVCK